MDNFPCILKLVSIKNATDVINNRSLNHMDLDDIGLLQSFFLDIYNYFLKFDKSRKGFYYKNLSDNKFINLIDSYEHQTLLSNCLIEYLMNMFYKNLLVYYDCNRDSYKIELYHIYTTIGNIPILMELIYMIKMEDFYFLHLYNISEPRKLISMKEVSDVLTFHHEKLPITSEGLRLLHSIVNHFLRLFLNEESSEDFLNNIPIKEVDKNRGHRQSLAFRIIHSFLIDDPKDKHINDGTIYEWLMKDEYFDFKPYINTQMAPRVEECL